MSKDTAALYWIDSNLFVNLSDGQIAYLNTQDGWVGIDHYFVSTALFLIISIDLATTMTIVFCICRLINIVNLNKKNL